ncbi:MAG: transcription termination factor NusA [Oscillospiraceae bacterium]|nr:transcription termination factor NusA [Oscillospiraceae bacterium]
MNNAEFFAALAIMEKDKGIPAAELAEKIGNAIAVAVRKDYGNKDNVFCSINIENHAFELFLRKTVVEEITDPNTEILIDDAVKYDKKAIPGGEVEIKLDTAQLGRIVAQTAKHVIRQGIREAEREQTLAEFESLMNQLITVTVVRSDPRTGNITVRVGKNEAILPSKELQAGEVFREGQMIKVYVADVHDTEKGPKIMLSRTNPGLVRKLLENEIPEIYDGTIEIKSVAREAGMRTKVAVWSGNENVDAVGSCIGPKGARVNRVVDELGGEKIDVVRYSENPLEFLAGALSPAEVLSAELEPDNPKVCHVIVPDNHLSLAIGNKGQNVRLAAKLTGMKIDIRPESAPLPNPSPPEVE